MCFYLHRCLPDGTDCSTSTKRVKLARSKLWEEGLPLINVCLLCDLTRSLRRKMVKGLRSAQGSSPRIRWEPSSWRASTTSSSFTVFAVLSAVVVFFWTVLAIFFILAQIFWLNHCVVKWNNYWKAAHIVIESRSPLRPYPLYQLSADKAEKLQLNVHCERLSNSPLPQDIWLQMLLGRSQAPHGEIKQDLLVPLTD